MKSALKGLALLLLVGCAVWLAVLWHWQRTLRDVGTADVVAWLVVLPLLLFAALLLLRWAWRGVVVPARAAAAAAASVTAAAPAAAAAPARAVRPAALLAAAVHLPGGASVADLDGALKDQAAQPEPDAELTDDDGLPIHAARLKELDVDALAAELAPLHAPEQEPHPRTRRALAALAPVLDEIALALPVDKPSTGLRVLLHLPDDTPVPDRELALAWLQQRIAAVAPEWAARLQPRVLGGPALALWQQTEQLLAALAQEGRADLLLLAAAHSELDDGLLARWSSQRLLFHAQRQPRGWMPGEGAAALLVAPPDAPAQAMAELHRAAWAERSQPVDAPGRVSSQTLEAVIASVLEAAQLAPEQLPALACDADRHGARNGELFGAVIARLPQLDAMQDVRALGAACGHQGTVGLLASVALAAHATSAPPDGDTPPPTRCLVLNLDDPRWRLGLLVSAPPTAAPPLA